MKRVYKSPKEPEALRRYRLAHPDETWEHFRRRTGDGYKQIKRQILEDQHGLCAYCEISIKHAEHEGEVDDFRVEHFYPKRSSMEAGHNYHLDWRNLLGVCHGGSQPDVPDSEWRYSEKKYDRSCDVPKGGKDISDLILNPLKIPVDRRIFLYKEHTGQMLVDRLTCPKYLRRKAKRTIRELNLNAPRLMRMRLEVIQTLQDTISEYLSQGYELEDILDILAANYLLPNKENQCLPFFSVIRWYLGDAAEKVLKKRSYKL